jgi:hypothetical protein
MEPRSSKAETAKALGLIKPPCARASLLTARLESKSMKPPQLGSDQAVRVQALKRKPSELAS